MQEKEGDAMAKTMTASHITDGQIDAAVEQFRAALRKKRDQCPSASFQRVLGLKNLGMRLVDPMLKLVEEEAHIVIHDLITDRSIAPEKMIADLRRREYIFRDVLEAMPRNAWMGRVEFFKIDGNIGPDDLAREYKSRGLIPDPYAVVAMVATYHPFAAKHPLAAQWVDEGEDWCYVGFDLRGSVRVDRYGRRWNEDFWFGGKRMRPPNPDQ